MQVNLKGRGENWADSKTGPPRLVSLCLKKFWSKNGLKATIQLLDRNIANTGEVSPSL